MIILKETNFLLLRSIVCLLFLSLNQLVFGQEGADVIVYKGNNVPFMFSSINDYRSLGGKELTGWSKIKVKLQDDLGAVGWEVNVSVDDDLFDGQDGNSFSSLYLEVQIQSVTPAFPSVAGYILETDWVPLSTTPTVIMSGTNLPANPLAVEYELVINYRCGFNGVMVNQAWDYYTDNIIFTITSKE